ncbi:hypothetical protein J2801_006077 [Paraburkholderia phenoliruptrix]|nr:hypothetical protein [Paraburkholderia phenoliruptrix]
MTRSYDYEGFMLGISVSLIPASDRTSGSQPDPVTLLSQDISVASAAAVFSPLRFREARGRPFGEADALMGG